MIGEWRQAALWFNGDEQKGKAERVLRNMLSLDAQTLGVDLGEVELEVIDANSQRLNGAVPPESGAQVLAAYAEVIGLKTTIEDAGFLANLEPDDLERLRKATRRAYLKANPGAISPSQSDLDAMVGRLAPETARRLVSH